MMRRRISLTILPCQLSFYSSFQLILLHKVAPETEVSGADADGWGEEKIMPRQAGKPALYVYPCSYKLARNTQIMPIGATNRASQSQMINNLSLKYFRVTSTGTDQAAKVTINNPPRGSKIFEAM